MVCTACRLHVVFHGCLDTWHDPHDYSQGRYEFLPRDVVVKHCICYVEISKNKKYVLWNVYLPNVVRCIPYTVIEIFEYNCNDLELGRFKVIQGQRSWCKSIAHRCFPIRLPLTKARGYAYAKIEYVSVRTYLSKNRIRYVIAV